MLIVLIAVFNTLSSARLRELAPTAIRRQKSCNLASARLYCRLTRKSQCDSLTLLSFRRRSQDLLVLPELLHGRDGGDAGRVHDGAVQVDGGAQRRRRRRRLPQQGQEDRR